MADPVETHEYRLEKLENDYGTWVVLFQASLEDKELWEAISEPRPDEAADPTGAAAWTKKDKRAFGRIKMSVALHHLPTAQACGSAKAAWDALEAIFSTKNNARRLQLTQDFAMLKMNPGETLLAYSGRTKKLQLEMMETGHQYDDNSTLIPRVPRSMAVEQGAVQAATTRRCAGAHLLQKVYQKRQSMGVSSDTGFPERAAVHPSGPGRRRSANISMESRARVRSWVSHHVENCSSHQTRSTGLPRCARDLPAWARPMGTGCGRDKDMGPSSSGGASLRLSRPCKVHEQRWKLFVSQGWSGNT